MKSYPVLSVQDISCIGQCSLTVALPVLSAMGHECAILPTSLLSSHTAFAHTSICQLEHEIPHIFAAWEKEDLRFGGVYTGYIGSVASVHAVKTIFSRFLIADAPIIVDPVFGDHGKLYRNFDEAYVESVRMLIESADVILPNVTEACFLTNTPYTESPDHETVRMLHEKMRVLGAKSSVITGIHRTDGRIAVSIDDGLCEEATPVLHETQHIDRPSHGAGDVFASIVAGRIFSGRPLVCAAREAADFVCRALKETPDEHWYGLSFEKLLSELIK